jgi:hypothetical protein
MSSHKVTALDTWITTLCARLKGLLPGAEDILALALFMSAQDQFTKLCGFVDQIYQELTQVVKFPKGPALLLVGGCVGLFSKQ